MFFWEQKTLYKDECIAFTRDRDNWGGSTMEESGRRNRTRENDITRRFYQEIRKKAWLPVLTLAISLLLIGRPVSAEITMSFTQPSIAIGFYHTVALKSDGTVTAWGYDYYGQSTVPDGLTGVTAVAAGAYHTVALKSDGTVVAWGQNLYGQISVPPYLSGVKAIAAGAYHTVALKNDGTVVAWGYNDQGQSTVPAGLTDVIAISAAGYHTLALKSDGTVVAWGYNDNGESTVPANLTGVATIAAGGYHSVALKTDGTIATWGRKVEGQCNVPEGLTGVVAIAAGTNHTAVLKSDGTVVAWGDNTYSESIVPNDLIGVTALTAGKEHSVALKNDGTVEVWGRNSYGEGTPPVGLNLITRYRVTTNTPAIVAGDSHTVALKSDGTVVAWGDNTYGESTVPAEASGITAVAAGAYHTVALKSDGTVAAWGKNDQGQTVVPVGLTDVAYIAGGGSHTVALKSDGTVVAWGDNTYGESAVPVGLSGVTAVAAGAHHTVALKSDGTVTAWGDNMYGESAVPVGLSGVTAVATGAHHTVALMNDGTVIAWGGNDQGQTTVPAGLTGVVYIAAGGSHTVALKSDGTLVAWGGNDQGQTTVRAGLNLGSGRISCIPTSVGYNSSSECTITPGIGYQVLDVKAGPTEGVMSSIGAYTSYIINNITADMTIAATFKANAISDTIPPITTASPAGGTYSAAQSITLSCSDGSGSGCNSTYYCFGIGCTPATLYRGAFTISNSTDLRFASIDNAGNTESVKTQTFTITTAAPTLIAAAGPNGSITPSGTLTVPTGSNVTFTLTTNAGYRVADVLVDGASVGALTSYTFSNVQTGHTITATFTLDVYTVTAAADVNGSITPSGTITVNKGDSPTCTITPDAGYDVRSVIVDGVSKGAITSYTFANITANHTINAFFKVKTYTITVSAGTGGSITWPLGTTTMNIGTTQTYTITPTAGYHILDVQVDGVSVGAVGTYTFTNVTSNHTIAATFEANPSYTITASAGANGTLSPSGSVSVLGGTNKTFIITPNAGYRIVDVNIDGTSAGPLTTYTFVNIADNHSISATFTLILYYDITASAGPNGSISPSGTVSVQQFKNQTYTITPSAGYRVADVQVDGASVGAPISYAFTNVQATHTISATFTVDVYTVTASADVNGSITPSGTTTVNRAASQTYTISPNQGYQVLNVIVDGASMGAITSYTFTNITANHSINAYFKVITYTIAASAATGGSISPLGTATLNLGASQTYTITPKAGYRITDVLVDGASVGAVATYAFTNVTGNHAISATFGTNPSYTITASAGANGTISPGTVTVLGGASQKFTFAAAAGYRVADVQVDGASVGAPTSYTFSNIQGNHTISASFTLNVYTITSAADVNGGITPSGTLTVNKGASQTYTITPDPGHLVRSVIVDGANRGAITSFTFTNIIANHTINAYFK